MKKTRGEWISHLNKIIEDAEIYCVLARDTALQKKAVETLSDLLKLCAGLKQNSIEAGDEDFANLLLGFECVVSGRSEELRMWVALKEERPDEAWEHLVSAQLAASGAARAHLGFSHVSHHAVRLEEIERLVFPPQIFVSAGYIVRRQECSICGGEYGECNHLVGRPYWGKLCHVIARDIEPNHVAMVERPADKRCRVTHFSTESGQRNRMTWAIEQPLAPNSDEGSNNSNSSRLETTAIIDVVSSNKLKN